jgi:hypothetical protein
VIAHLAIICMATLGACKSDDHPKTMKVDPANLQPGPIRHDELSPELVARITKLHDTFEEVDPSPLSRWIDDFQRDQHPESEIKIYEGMARAYTAFCRGRTLSLDAKREVYGVVIQRSASPDDEVLKTVHVKAITVDDVKTILSLYDMPPKPITVAPSTTP